jgi:hypothetical protein
MKSIYSKAFEGAVKASLEKNLYVGTGNPSSSILIIGKEASIDMNADADQYEKEFSANARDWQQNIAKGTEYSNMPNHHNPLFPYKGQLNKVESRDKSGGIVKGAGGTSRTWYYYQKLIDGILRDGQKSATIDFHAHSFITELNQVTGRYSHLTDKEKRKASILERQELLRMEFFQSFPVVIVAAGHYVRDFDINLQALFNVNFVGPTVAVGTSNWINVHRQHDGASPKLLLHTNQLSMVSNALVEKLVEVCRGEGDLK